MTASLESEEENCGKLQIFSNHNYKFYWSGRYPYQYVRCARGLVGLASILGALELDLESLGTNLVTVHCLDGRVGRLVCCEGDKTCGERLVRIPMASKRDSPKHLERFVCLSTKTLADTMVPNGWNV